MPALHPPEFWTADMVRALPDDGKRYETVHGELLMTPAPRMWHQIVNDRLTNVLRSYLLREPVGMVLNLDADISWGPDVLVQPDIYVAPRAEMATLEWSRVQTLLLAVEILSPASGRADRVLKRQLYQEVGVPLYWIVDADEHFVEWWTPEAAKPVMEHERIIWHPAGATAPCVIELSEMFKPL